MSRRPSRTPLFPRRQRDVGPLDVSRSVLLIPLVIGLAAALVALGLFPLFGATGQAITKFDRKFLADDGTALDIPAFAARSTIFDAKGAVLANLADYNRVYVPLDQVSRIAQDAVLAIEDHGFYKHGPVDAIAIIRAALANLRAGRVVQGGSTISQQLVKNTQTGSAETFQRKFREAQDAIRLERTYSKRKILELYLNDVYFGHGAYGIASAAEWYFATPVEKLNLAQSSLLAGLIASPAKWDPISHPGAAVVRREQVLHAMLQYGYITQDRYQKASTRPIKLRDSMRTVNSFGPEPYFVRYVEDTILHPFKADPNYHKFIRLFGKSYQQRRTSLFQGGLRIYTTLQPDMQKEAADAVVAELKHQGPKPPADPEAAVVTVVPQTGAIEAMYGGTDFSKKQFNLATQAGRTAGSSFKAFTLAAAFEQGVPVGKVYNATSPVQVPSSKCFDPTGIWSPGNADPFEGHGFVNLATATADSINVVFAQLIADVGPANVAEVAKRMGVQDYAYGGAPVYIPDACAITLGAVQVNPLSMAAGYSTIANGGSHCYPFVIRKVVSATGKVLFKAKKSCKQVIDPKIAWQVTSLLKGVVQTGTGTAANIGRPQAGKTGTGESYQDAWFIGYVPQLVTAVWVGYSKDEIPMVNLPVLGGANAFGGTIAAPIWHDYMIKAVAGLPPIDFPLPPAPKSGTIPDVTGLKKDDAVKKLAAANFTAIVKDQACDKPQGIVCSQSPAGGTTAQLGTGVTINVSNGKSPKVSVPNVIGSTQGTAIAALKAVGFQVTVTYKQVSDPSKNNIVLDQAPVAGTQTKKGATVTITVGQLVTPTPTPPTSTSPGGKGSARGGGSGAARGAAAILVLVGLSAGALRAKGSRRT